MTTISADYKKQLQQMHQEQDSWGTTAEIAGASSVLRIAQENNLTDVLDYGCGKGYLKQGLTGLGVKEYDPGIPGKDEVPAPRELVACIDVLEHIEPEYIDAVLQDLARVTLKKGFFLISLIPAQAILPDGRNAHILLKSPEWWHSEVGKYFKVDNATVFSLTNPPTAYYDLEKYPYHSIQIEVSNK